ncbi:MAG TPA: hypothetical protein VEO56_15475 [Bacteroidota bacterium]|nr:hypothetical protein [Bacteroidota bacterium]
MTPLRAASVLLLIGAQSLYAQVVLPPDRGQQGTIHTNVFGLGLAAGPASGIGLSFRDHLPGYFSYQLTGGIIKVDEVTSYALGGEVQYDLMRGYGARFFITGALGYYYHANRGGSNQLDGPTRVGFGIGGEVPSGGGMHFAGELVFTYFSDGTVLPLPQAGFYYYFY